MTKKDTADTLERLDELIARLERLERIEGLDGIELFAATDSSGNPTAVAAGQLIESAWGTATANHVVYRFPTVAARTTALPSPVPGQLAYIDATHAVTLYTGTVWIEPGKQAFNILTQAPNLGPGAVVIPGSGFTFPSPLRRYELSFNGSFFKGGAAGAVTVSPGAAAPGQPGMNWPMTTPEGSTRFASWSCSGAVGGGSLTISCTAGTVTVEAGSTITVTDVGSI